MLRCVAICRASNAESIKRVDKPSTASSTFAVHSIPGEVVDDPVKTVEPSVTLAANVTEVEAPKGGGMTRSKNVQNLSLDYQAPSSANSSNVSALSVSLSNHTSSLGNWVPHTPAPVIESPGDDPVRSDKKLPSSTHLEPVLEVDTNSTDVATVVNEDESETLPVAKPKMKKMKKVKSSSECLDLVDLEGGAVDIDNEEYCMGDGVNESEEEEEEEEEEPLVINGATIAPVVKPTEADRGVRPPVTQSYRPNLHLDMASMAESIVEPSLVGSVAVRKVSASVIASRGLTAESFNPRRRKSLVQSKLDTPQIGEKNETVQVNYAENSAASSGADQIDISASAGAPHTGDKCVPLEVQTPQTVLVDTESERDVEDDELVDDVLTARAVFVIKRVMDKLAGLDFEERSVKASQCVGVHGPSEACSASNHKCKSPNSNEATGIAGTPNVEGPQSSGSAKNNTSITNMVKAREPLVVKEQVDRIIRQAVSNENLCQSFSGWCAFW